MNKKAGVDISKICIKVENENQRTLNASQDIEKSETFLQMSREYMITLGEAIDSSLGKKMQKRNFLNPQSLRDPAHTFLGIYLLQEKAKNQADREWWID